MSGKPVAPIILPDAIETESFRIIDAEMGPHDFSVIEWPVVRRAIHSTADFELGRSLVFHPRAVEAGLAAIRKGPHGGAHVPMNQGGITTPDLPGIRRGRPCCMCPPHVADQAPGRGHHPR